jgi:TolB protein
VAQDWVRTGTNLGAARIRLAAADFNPGAPDVAPLKTTFDTTFYNDLNNAGIFDMVSKSMAPPLMPASPQQINLAQWAAAPSNAAMVAFGSISASGGRLTVYGWLFDAKNPDSPQILGKQYNEAASQDNARLIAHRFADEIITRLGGGIPGRYGDSIPITDPKCESLQWHAVPGKIRATFRLNHFGPIQQTPKAYDSLKF